MRQMNSRAPFLVNRRFSDTNIRQNRGKARSENAMSCGRQPATSAMHSEPAKYHPHGRSDARPFIHMYRPHTENASPHMMGRE